MKKKVVIIGCGFAGVYASWVLSRFRRDLEVTVIDKKETFDFLPLLPDLIGRGITSEYLTYPIPVLSRNLGFEFVNQEAISLDIENNKVFTRPLRKAEESSGINQLCYDYLLISSGSETNFYGNNEIRKNSYKIDDVNDIKLLLAALENKKFDACVIAGAGYTGIEVATNLRVFLKKRSLEKRIILVERAPSILGPLPEWMKKYVLRNLEGLDIEVLTNTVVDKVGGDRLLLSNGTDFLRSLLLWVAGVKAADYLEEIKAEKNPQGRIKVDEFLRVKNNCFIVGDCALVSYRDTFLRMAVQFSIYQAVTASFNIIRSIRSQSLKKYKPLDLGYIVPMGNNKSCGNIMGLKAKGRLATTMHFSMCLYRLWGLRNKSGIISDLVRGGAR